MWLELPWSRWQSGFGEKARADPSEELLQGQSNPGHGRLNQS